LYGKEIRVLALKETVFENLKRVTKLAVMKPCVSGSLIPSKKTNRKTNLHLGKTDAQNGVF
jgi:hypothetical protein